MPTIIFNDTKIEKLDYDLSGPGIQIYWSKKLEGLGFEVKQTSSPIWVLKARVFGKWRRKKIGDYPQMDLQSAESKALEFLSLIKKGIDPWAGQAIRSANGAVTVKVLVDHWMRLPGKRSGRPKRKATTRDAADQIPRYIHDWLDLPASAITVQQILNRYHTIAQGNFVSPNPKTPGRLIGTEQSANAVMCYLQQCFGAGVSHFGLESNPVLIALDGSRYKKDPDANEKHRRLTDAEIAGVLNLKTWTKQNPRWPLMCHLQLYCGTRAGETSQLLWSYVTEDRITIPAKLAKGWMRHEIPVTQQIAGVLDRIKARSFDDRLFPAGGEDGFVNQPGYPCAQVATYLVENNVAKWFTSHDFRHTFSQVAYADVGIEHKIVGALLSHKSGDVTSIYAPVSWEMKLAAIRAVNEQLASIAQIT